MAKRRLKYASKWMAIPDASGWTVVCRLKDERKGDVPGNRIEWGRYTKGGEAARMAEVMNKAEDLQSTPPLRKPNKCATCGHPAEVTKCYDANEDRTVYGVMCRYCTLTMPAEYEDRDKAVRKWNRLNPKRSAK